LPPDAGFVQCKRVDHNGLKHHVSFLTHDKQALGIMLLACHQPRQILQEEIELLDLVGKQLSDIVSNAWLAMKLTEKEVARQRLLQALVKAQEDERMRLARELHDGAGQNLTSLLVRMKTLEKQVDDKPVRSALQGACNEVSEMIEYIRALSHQLRPAILEEVGLEKAIHDLVESLGEYDAIEWSVTVDLNGVVLPNEIETTVYRIAQEGITNILRHSQADQVRVSLVCDQDLVVIEVQDNGRGFDQSELEFREGSQHMGLKSMRERIELFAGRLHVESKKGVGTLIRGEVPVLEGVLQ
jgi:signal transduction histidine kinase